jgi:phosphohistidine swiveling domain-containing protein
MAKIITSLPQSTIGNLQEVSDRGGFNNGSTLREGSVDNGFGGGISRVCVTDYENEWENGVDYYFPLGGTYTYAKSINNNIPDASFDNTKNWDVGSYYKNLTTNSLYKCTDATTANAVWELQLDAVDSEVIHKNETPETKIGGLTLGVNLANTDDKWVAFGTSVTFQNNYTLPASAQLNLNLLNYGVSGSTSNNLASQHVNIPNWTSEYRLLSIEHSINDSAQAVSLVTFRTNIEACISNARSKGWPNNRILLINGNYCTNAPMITTMESYADLVVLIAKEQSVQYYDAYNYTKNNGGESLLSNGVHPTVGGGLIYTRGLIASMQGGMEITNSLTVDNGLVVNGIINATKKITTLGSIQTGNVSNNTPANTVNGDVIVPFTAGLITQNSQPGIIAKFTPIEDIGGIFHSTFRNYIENGRINFYVAGAVRGAQNLAFRINSNGILDSLYGIASSEDINIAFSKALRASSVSWINRIVLSESNSNTTFFNGATAGVFEFYTANGVLNAQNLAFKIFNNKSARVYGDFTIDENTNIGFNKNIHYVGAYTNKIVVSESTGALGLYAGRNTNGDINFYISKGVTNAANLAMKVAMNGAVLINTSINNGIDKLQVNGTITADAATLSGQVVIKSQLDTKVTVGVNNATTVVLTSANLNSTYPSATTGFKVYCDAIIAGAMTYEKTPTGWVGFACIVP